jgi:hypothetical protein
MRRFSIENTSHSFPLQRHMKVFGLRWRKCLGKFSLERRKRHNLYPKGGVVCKNQAEEADLQSYSRKKIRKLLPKQKFSQFYGQGYGIIL